MKLPRIVASNNIPGSIPGGYASADAFGGQSAQALGQGVEQLGRSVTRTADTMAHVDHVLRVADARVEYEGAFSKLKQEFADRDIAIREQGVDPDQYPKLLQDALKEITEKHAGTMKYPESQALLKKGVDQFRAEKLTAAKYKARELKDALVNVREGVQQDEDANTAVFGATPEERQAAFGRGLDRPRRALLEQRLTAAQAEQRTSEFLATVEKAGAIKAFENPTLRGLTIATLRTGGLKHLKPEAQLQLADTLEAKEHARDAAIRTEQERVRKEAATIADKDVTDAVASGDMRQAASVLEANRRVFEGPRYEHWAEKIKKGPVAETDAAVRREIMPEVYNVSGDPRRTDDKLRKYFGQGRVADDDYQKWGSHLETRINRLQARAEGEANRAEQRKDREAQRDESRLKHEEGEAQAALRELTRVTGPAADALNPAAQDALNWGLEDMARNSPLYGKGNERPMEWLERNKVGIMARIGTVASNRLRTIDETAVIKEPDTQGATIQAAERARQRLLERRNDRTLFKSEADWYDQMRAVEEKVSLIRQLELYGKKPPAPSGGQPSTGPRPPLSEPAKTTGKTGGR